MFGKIQFERKDKEIIEYFTAIAMIIFGMGLCLVAFWTPPVGEVHTSILGVLGQILIFVGAIFHLNIKFKDQQGELESKMSDMQHTIDELKKAK